MRSHCAAQDDVYSLVRSTTEESVSCSDWKNNCEADVEFAWEVSEGSERACEPASEASSKRSEQQAKRAASEASSKRSEAS